MDLYPKLMHKNVLLLDGAIINWKVGTRHWPTVQDAFDNRQYLWLFKIPEDRLSVASYTKVVNDLDENNQFFEDDEWLKKYPIHAKFKGFMPYE